MPTGNLRKMVSELNSEVTYYLPVGDEKIQLNQLIGKEIQLEFTGKINCIQCGRDTKKSFQQGYCYPCYQKLYDCSMCMLHPERCHHGEGSCNPDDWVHVNCMTPHIVYLANSSGLKVGVTRQTQVPTRWIDQGAVQGLPIFNTSNRYQAGLIEVAIKAFFNDKTNWRAMLKGQNEPINLFEERENVQKRAGEAVEKVLEQFESSEISEVKSASVTEISYPVLEYPTKITSLNFDKEPVIKGVLKGIKGQYLMLDAGVLNIRKFGGYEIVFA